MKRAAILLMAGVMALTMMHTVPAEEAAQEEAAFIQDISYMDDDEKFHKLDVHGTADGETKPVIVEIHGGAYIGGQCRKYRGAASHGNGIQRAAFKLQGAGHVPAVS